MGNFLALKPWMRGVWKQNEQQEKTPPIVNGCEVALASKLVKQIVLRIRNGVEHINKDYTCSAERKILELGYH